MIGIMDKVPAETAEKIRRRVDELDMDTVQICRGTPFKDNNIFVAVTRERLEDKRIKTRYMMLVYDEDKGEFIRILTGLTYADALIETAYTLINVLNLFNSRNGATCSVRRGRSPGADDGRPERRC